MTRPLTTRRLPHYVTVAGCRKASYRTREGAEEALQRILARAARRKTRRRQTLPRRAYECPDCGRWHLSSKPARTQRQAS